MTELFAPEAIAALFQVVMIDLTLAGDNAIVVGMAAAGLPEQQRTRAILFGMAGATALLVMFAGITTQLLKLVGLLFAGGVLLLWVCWKMWRELRATANREEEEAVEALTGLDINADGTVTGYAPRKTLAQAAGQIIIADLSMSLDNVLAVAGAAREHPVVLVFGLSLSIFLMGVAARFIASLLHKYRWIAYLGLGVILYVALGMVFRGAHELTPIVNALAGLS
ncbi:MAG TPA: TerC family protein [Bradyrhizobium sp.]|jgi:YjbE family integral membrane protein|uniref:TerC family protein n=1 Tax=Bradyrhizobium sp. TaxID=376 RepID=UPI002C59ECF5|nr:TerC family protein [Bradyrhizobium sp.]HXB77320.1 TerC family protein [Bradyrhizobium sp.]